MSSHKYECAPMDNKTKLVIVAKSVEQFKMFCDDNGLNPLKHAYIYCFSQLRGFKKGSIIVLLNFWNARKTWEEEIAIREELQMLQNKGCVIENWGERLDGWKRTE